MKKILLPFLVAFVLLLGGKTRTQAQTSLSAGDIAFIGFFTDGVDASSPQYSDGFTFILLKTISAGTVIYFTDNGWDGTTPWVASASEMHFTWTAPVGGLSIGSIVYIYESTTAFNTGIASVGTLSGLLVGTVWHFASSGDQILAYQSTGAAPSSPTFIAAIDADYTTTIDQTNGWCTGTATSGYEETFCNIPNGLTNGTNCVALFNSTQGELWDNCKYTGTLTGSASTIRTAINTYTNWNGSNSTPYDISSSAFPTPSITADVPTITGISPTSGPTAGGTSVVITGTNLTGATAVKFGITDATGYTVNSSTQITATSPAGSAGAVDITATTSGGTSATSSSDQFTYIVVPTVTSISPTSGSTTGGTSVTITGTNLTGATAVSFGGTAATGYTVNSATQITATSPAKSAGTVDITITTAGGTSATSASDQFTYIAVPGISGISPTSGTTAGGTSVVITGTNLTGASDVSFGGTAATGYTVNSATQITATSPAKSAGIVDITITTAGGTSATSASDQFTYIAPPSATTNAAASVTSTGATLNGSVNANNASTTVTFEYGLDTGYGTTVTADQSPVTGSSATSVSKAITGLSASTTYHFRVIGVNGGGTTNGSDQTFTTSPLAPTVTTQAASSIAATTATGNGNITSLGVPNPTAYGVCWNTGGTPTTSDSKTDNGAASAIGAFTASMTGLTASTTYHVRAFATNTANTSYGTDVSFTTLSGVPTTQASEIVFSSVTQTSMTLDWTNGNGSKRAVFMKQANTGTALPIDNTTYTANTIFSDGTQIGTSGWYCVYNNTGSNVAITGLISGSDYIAQVFEYNGAEGSESYFTSTATNNPNSQATLDFIPEATNMTQTVSYIEGAVSTTINAIVVTDTDPGETISATLTLAYPGAGTLSASSGNGETYNATTGIWTITASVAEVNAALAAMAFTPSATNDYDSRIITHIQDAANTGPNDGIITLDVTAINNAPAYTSTPILTAKEGIRYTYNASALDPDGNRLTYSASAPGLPSWLSLGASDVIDIIAGTLGSTNLNYPAGVRFDADDNMYIADWANRVIRKIDAVTGVSTVVVGTGTKLLSGEAVLENVLATSANLNGVSDIQFDSQGNLYFSDYHTFNIRKVDHTTQMITTVLGVPWSGSEPWVGGTPALSWTGGVSNKLLAHGTAMSYAWTMAIDRWDNIYVANAGNNAIYKITGDSLSLVAGTPGGYSTGGDLLSGSVVDVKFNAPTGIAVDVNGDLYVADRDNRLVRKINVALGTFTTIAGTYGVNTSTGDGGAATSSTIVSPHRIAVDAHGNVYVTEEDDSGPAPTGLKVRRIDAVTGIINTVAGTGTQGTSGNGGSALLAQLYDPYGLTYEESGDIYISDGSSNVVREIFNRATLTGIPTAADAGSHEITINAFDGTNTTPQTFTITVSALTQATNVSFANVLMTQMDLSWTRGTGDSCAVFMYQGTTGTASPLEDVYYAADTTFQSGDQIGTSGWYCVYRGTGTSATVTGLSSSTIYRVHVCEFNYGSIYYNTAASTNNPKSQVTETAYFTDGTNYYSTWSGVASGISGGGTATLLADYVQSSGVTVFNDFTLDLNGHSFTGAQTTTIADSKALGLKGSTGSFDGVISYAGTNSALSILSQLTFGSGFITSGSVGLVTIGDGTTAASFECNNGDALFTAVSSVNVKNQAVLSLGDGLTYIPDIVIEDGGIVKLITDAATYPNNFTTSTASSTSTAVLQIGGISSISATVTGNMEGYYGRVTMVDGSSLIVNMSSPGPSSINSARFEVGGTSNISTTTLAFIAGLTLNNGDITNATNSITVDKFGVLNLRGLTGALSVSYGDIIINNPLETNNGLIQFGVDFQTRLLHGGFDIGTSIDASSHFVFDMNNHVGIYGQAESFTFASTFTEPVIAGTPVPINADHWSDFSVTKTPPATMAVNGWLLKLNALYYQPIIYVDASKTDDTGDGLSWTNAKKTLQAALDLSLSGYQIWVKEGTYKPTLEARGIGNRYKTFQMKDGVAIYGGFDGTETSINERSMNSHMTILSGDLDGNDTYSGTGSTLSISNNSENCYTVIWNDINAAGTTATAILDGFVIKGGNADGETNATYGGGGMHNNATYPTIRNCRFEYNSAKHGAAFFSYSSTSAFYNCVFVNNYGSDVSSFGGTIYNNAGNGLAFNNCDIVNNYSANVGGVVSYNTSTILNNSVVWGNYSVNSGHQIYCTANGNITLNYSCYQNEVDDVNTDGGTFTPTNCITADPEFVDVVNGDYRIAGTSSCLDLGNDSYNNLATDIRGAGFGRKLLKTDALTIGTIDIGAYEFMFGTDPDQGCTDPTDGGVIASNQSGCVSFDPDILTNVALPSGENGTIEYKWQQSTTNDATGFVDIALSNFSTYDPDTVSVTTWFRRLARVSCRNTWLGAMASNTVEMLIYPASVGGTISGTSPIIYGESTGTMTMSGFTGDVLKWQHKLDAAEFVDIVGTATSTFTETPVSAGTWTYRAEVQSGVCSSTWSNEFVVTVDKKALTTTGATADGKIYDGNTDATISGASLVGIVGLDDVALDALTGTFATEIVGTHTVTATLTLMGTDKDNYSLTQPTGLSAEITAKELTVSGATADDKVYDDNTDATISGASLVGIVGLDDVDLDALTGTFASEIVGTHSVTATLTLMGTDKDNYSLTQPTGLSAEITAKELTVSGATADDKIYDGNTDATISGASLVGIVGLDDVALDALTGTFATEIVGTHSVTATLTLMGTDKDNYSLTQPTGLSAEITAKELTVSGATADDKLYDGNTDATISGASLVGIVGLDDVDLDALSGTFASEIVGTHTVTATLSLTGIDATNYSLTQPTGLSAEITAKELTVTGATADDKVYDGNTNATISGAVLVGIVGTDDVALDALTGIFASEIVGTHSVTATLTLMGTDKDNYSLTQPTGLSAEITAKELTVNGATADDKIYDGNTDATISGASLVGIVGLDDVALDALTGTFATEIVGTHTVTATLTLMGTDRDNY
ncbi:MAG: hypothetical protein HOO86_16350, partial [Bacteroidales bacterium]|nr:hypothetical protein [Bacteroidales bacterium]